MRGIRPRNALSGNQTAFVALFSTGSESEWPDAIDRSSGCVSFFGDNREPNIGLLETTGNRLLHKVFSLDFDLVSDREKCPPFLVFSAFHDAPPRTVRFEGIAVPGCTLPESDWCRARFFKSSDGKFLNFEIKLTLLADPVIPRQWLKDLLLETTNSESSPTWFKSWVATGRRVPLSTS
jgi:hypothetical protein